MPYSGHQTNTFHEPLSVRSSAPGCFLSPLFDKYVWWPNTLHESLCIANTTALTPFETNYNEDIWEENCFQMGSNSRVTQPIVVWLVFVHLLFGTINYSSAVPRLS